MKTYKTTEVANIVGFHPNTVRRYEEWKLIPKPERAKNGYRIYTDYHIELLKTARIAFQIEILQSGLRSLIREMIRALAAYEFNEAHHILDTYLNTVDKEIDNAEEAIQIVEKIITGDNEKIKMSLKRTEASLYLGVTTDALRNWELNGLLTLKRSNNGYRVYEMEDLNRLKIIRSLRSANYSLESILRLLKSLDQEQNKDIRHVLNYSDSDEDIISVCDNLIISLENAKKNALELTNCINHLQKTSEKLS